MPDPQIIARNPNEPLRFDSFEFDHPQITDTTTYKFAPPVPTGQKFRVTRAAYHNVTGLAGDGTNAFAGTIQNAAVVMASLFNTDTGDAGGASLAADTWVEGTLSATDASRVLAAGEALTLVLTEDGAATLPAGRVRVEGYYLKA